MGVLRKLVQIVVPPVFSRLSFSKSHRWPTSRECPICFEEFENPKLLPCNHTLCLGCLENVRKEKSLTCPMCNSKHDVPDRGVVAFSDNPHVTQLITNRKELRAMKDRMESKLKKNKKGDEKSLDDVKEAMEECSLGSEEAACATDSKEQKTSKQEASNALTFSGQKLALIQCEYNPKCCGHCKKPASTESSGKLKSCSKCKTAKYCSRNCQTKDWQSKHRVHCNEIIRLKTMIEKDEARVSRPISPGDSYLHATIDGNPWLIDRNIEFYNMCIHKGKVFPMGFNIKTFNCVVCMYNAATGVKKGIMCRLGAPETVVGLTAIEAGKSRYLVVTHAPEEHKPWRMDFWTYPLLAAEPAYTFRAKAFTLGAIHFSDGNLLVVNPLKQIVEEFKVSSFPVKRTGNNIQTGLIPWTNQIRNRCVMKPKQKEKLLLLQNFTNDVESALRCVDYRGRQLWEVQKQNLGDISFQPEDVCADEDGHVFTLDSRGNRVGNRH